MPTWTTDQLLGVKDLGPAVIGEAMHAAKEALLQRSAGDARGHTIYGPAITGTPPEPEPDGGAGSDGASEADRTPATRDELEGLKYAELRGLAAEAGLTFEGNPTKIALVEALLTAGVAITIEDQA